jgi:hypothetical protein
MAKNSSERWGDGTLTIRSERLFNRKKKKVYYLDHKKNSEGDFIKITEACGGKRDTIVIPVNLADPFIAALEKVKGGVLKSTSTK